MYCMYVCMYKPPRGNVTLARNLHTHHLNARYPKLDYSQATIDVRIKHSVENLLEDTHI